MARNKRNIKIFKKMFCYVLFSKKKKKKKKKKERKKKKNM